MPGGTALFSNSSSRNQSKNLVEFKAGKMTMKGKMVHPDKRKGLVYIYQSEDSLMHFCWKDRTTGVVEDDLIIFPDDVEFKRVPQCTTGRVYILKFKTSSRKFFFWIQEAKTDKDEDNCRKVNEVLNNPPANLGSQRSGGATPDGDLQNLLSSMSQQQLMQLFGGVSIGGLSNILGTLNQGSNTSKSSSLSAATTTPISTSLVPTPKTPTSPANTTKPFTTPQAPKKPTNGSSATTSSTTPASGSSQADPIMLSQLQSYLQNLQQGGAGQSTPQQNIDLSTAMNTESLQAVLNNPELVKELQKHIPSVGSDTPTQEQLKSTLSSPQFQQALSMFSSAFQSGQLGPVVSQFEMGPEAVNAANSGNMEEFVKALQSASISQQEGSGESSSKKEEDKNKKKNDDEDMNLD